MKLICCFFYAFFLVIITGCSLSTNFSAPVENISPSRPVYKKGTIKTARYKVKKGDTLFSIAWGAGRDYRAIAWLNKMKKPYTIYPGQWLTLSKVKPKVNKRKGHRTQTKTKGQISQVSQKTKAETKGSSNRSKKILDKKNQATYSVTVRKQKNNNKVVENNEISQQKISRWQWPSKGKIIGRFSNNTQGNKGIKFSGSLGDSVRAAAAGKVVYAGSALRGYGNLVIIKHNNDYLSAYAHANKILVREQQLVKAGQAVATMGKTGTNRIMLHFEIRYHGKSVDPLRYLPK